MKIITRQLQKDSLFVYLNLYECPELRGDVLDDIIHKCKSEMLEEDILEIERDIKAGKKYSYFNFEKVYGDETVVLETDTYKIVIPFPHVGNELTEIGHFLVLRNKSTDESYGRLTIYATKIPHISENIAWVANLEVFEKNRGQGLGELLLEGALGFAKKYGYDEIYLSATDAIGYYRKLGLEEVHILEMINGKSINSIFKMSSIKSF